MRGGQDGRDKQARGQGGHRPRSQVNHFIHMFAHLTPAEIEEIQRLVDERVAEINRLAGKEVIGPVAK